MPKSLLSQSEFHSLRELDTCMVSNTIETFKVRPRSTGCANSSVRRFFEDFPPMVGYAATACVRSEEPRFDKKIVHDRCEWGRAYLRIPAPRIVVLEDMHESPSRGTFIRDVQAAIFRALCGIGVIRNGVVCELPRIQESRFHRRERCRLVFLRAHLSFRLDENRRLGSAPWGFAVRRRAWLSEPSLQAALQVPAIAALSDKESELISLCWAGQIPLDKVTKDHQSFRMKRDSIEQTSEVR